MTVLNGIKVLDLSKVIAGPTAAMLLGDLGADVIKIEEPQQGDEARAFPPFQNGVSTVFMACNRNKRGLSLDLKSKEGLKLFYDLVKKSDVIIEGFRPGVAEKLKIDYDTVKHINPRIIYCSISGFGRKGPKAYHGGYDALAQAYGGLMSITGLDKESAPIRSGYSVSDITTGLNATLAILAALLQRFNTGKGDLVETSLLQTQVGLMSYYATMYNATKIIPEPIGSRHPNFAPYQAYKALNGYIMLGISNNKLWNQFCSISLFSHLKDIPNFKNNDLRVKHIKQLANEIEKVTKQYSKHHLIELLEGAVIPCSPINNIQEVVENEQVLINNMLVDLEHPIAGNYKATNVPFNMNSAEYVFDKHPPQKGEHNKEILKDLGYSDSYISELIEQKVLGNSDELTEQKK
ncbi:CaiB/BaiF CoA transferase family protein [Peribacillus sp. NPDC060186]